MSVIKFNHSSSLGIRFVKSLTRFLTLEKRLQLVRGLFLFMQLCLVAGCEYSRTDGPKGDLRIHVDQIDVQQINNAIIGFIVEKGYNRRLEGVEHTVKEAQRMLASGEIDISLEIWKINNLDWYEQALQKGQIVDLGPIYTGGRQFWIIPRWLAERYDIRSVFDMKQHWRLFQDPEDPSKGIFFNCIYGWTCRDINNAKLAAYGLDRYYNAISPISPEALETVLENAQLKHQPVFGYYWMPNALLAAYEWQILEEPPHSEGCWKDVLRDANQNDGAAPATACAYGENEVIKIASTALARKAPEVAKMLRRMRMRVEDINWLLLWHRQDEQRGWRAVAVYFLRNYPERWFEWVSPGAKAAILKALDAEPHGAVSG